MNKPQVPITDWVRRISSYHLLPWEHWQHPDVAELWEGVDIVQRIDTSLLGWVFWREGAGSEYEFSVERSGFLTTGEAFNAAMSAYSAGEVVPVEVNTSKPKEAPCAIDWTPDLETVLHEYLRADALQKTDWKAAVSSHTPVYDQKREAAQLARNAQSLYNTALANFRRLCPTSEMRLAALALMNTQVAH